MGTIDASQHPLHRLPLLEELLAWYPQE